MPESSCLHIQDSASGPIRVLELPWPLVRIGRGSLCEVRLNDPDLAGEVCRFQRRGGNWQIEPLVSDAVWIDARPVNGVRLLPYSTPIQIGPYRLTLHPSKLAAPDWNSYSAHGEILSSQESSVKIETAVPNIARDERHSSARPARLAPEIASTFTPEPLRPAPAYEAPPSPLDLGDNREMPVSALRDQQRWEHRWRAAGEKLRAASPPKTPRSSLSTRLTEASPVDSDRPTPPSFRLDPIPLKEAALPRAHVVRATPATLEPAAWSRPLHLEPVPPATHADPEVAPLRREAVTGTDVTPEVVSAEIYPLLLEEERLDLEAPTLPREVEPIEIEVTSTKSDDPRLDEERVLAEPLNLKAETRAPESDGSIESERGFRPATIANPARRIGEETIGDSGQSTVDARISAWNPSWFEPQGAPDDSRASAHAQVAEIRQDPFVATTEVIAPAECLETITTCLDDKSFRESSVSLTTSIENRNRESRHSSPRNQESIEAHVGSARRRVGPVSAPIAELRPEPPSTPAGTTRADDLASAPMPRAKEGATRSAESEWPSVEDIMAAHRRAPVTVEEFERNPKSRTAAHRNPGRDPLLATPSLAQEPECWELPLWLGWPPLAFVSLLLGVLGCMMSWSWMREARNASIVANRLLGKEAEVINGRPVPLPEWVVAPSPTWYRSTARHLTNWAAYLGRSADSNDQIDEIRALLAGAVAASPAYAPARLALARIDDLGPDAGKLPTQGLGLSRDPIALAWTARRFLNAGRKDVALPLYRQALVLATQPELSPETTPIFADEPQGKRYLLPGEDVVREIVAGLVADRNLGFSEWSPVLPQATVAPLVAARLLRDQSQRDSEAALDLILGRDDQPEAEGDASAIRHAVRAEAFAMRAKWKDAEREYYAAIDRIDHDATHRSWWFNLADIEHRLKDETQRQEAIKKALAAATTTDDIARRAADLRRGQANPISEAPRMRGAGLKAN